MKHKMLKLIENSLPDSINNGINNNVVIREHTLSMLEGGLESFRIFSKKS